MANSVDPDETLHYELFHLDLHCLQNNLSWSAGLKALNKIYFSVEISECFTKALNKLNKKKNF